ncbi:hypothetical protein ACIBVL_15765 [Streptomyces sp. NPDC049687]|uniref:hypothetical protein n=1 Tax=Streptomyces sp. NPDC049687 TaxID=3365596 RepID=UPI003797FB13
MAKTPKKDYNSGPTTQQTDTSGIFGNNSVMGSSNDYDNWDWKQIEAVIVGGSNMAKTDEVNRAHTVASPQSLYDAGDTFQFVQDVLQMVSENIVAQANALAGEKDSPWQGTAADAFMTMMQTFSKQVASSANALSGGSMNASVAQTLVDAGNDLAVAQANIVTIDHWYGQQALNIGIKPMKNGLIPVSKSPEIVRMMTEDMRKVLHTLARQYSSETRTLNQVSPTNITSPLSGTNPDLKQPDTTAFKQPDTSLPLSPKPNPINVGQGPVTQFKSPTLQNTQRTSPSSVPPVTRPPLSPTSHNTPVNSPLQAPLTDSSGLPLSRKSPIPSPKLASPPPTHAPPKLNTTMHEALNPGPKQTLPPVPNSKTTNTIPPSSIGSPSGLPLDLLKTGTKGSPLPNVQTLNPKGVNLSNVGDPKASVKPVSFVSQPPLVGGPSSTKGSGPVSPLPLPKTLANQGKNKIGSPSGLPSDLLKTGTKGSPLPNVQTLNPKGVNLSNVGNPNAPVKPVSFMTKPPTGNVTLPTGHAPTVPSSGVPGGGGMPFMPMSPSGGVPRDEHRSDSSGLLSDGVKPWSDKGGELPAGQEHVLKPGVDPGGLGLSRPLPNQSLPDGSLSHLQVPTGHAPTVPLPDGLLSHRSVSGPGGRVSGVPSGVLDHGGAGGVSLAGAPGGGVPSSGVPGGGGMPFMPMSPSGGVPRDEHRSDSSGLLSDGVKPWSDKGGELPAGQEHVLKPGVDPGGLGLSRPLPNQSLPDGSLSHLQVPTGHAPTVPLPDGLLSHRSVSGPGGRVSGVPSGVLDHGGAGGVSLAGAPGGGVPSSGVPGGGGMPFMPMSPSGGVPRDEHRSDSSGLLSGDPKPWSDKGGELPAGQEHVLKPGVDPGGLGLSRPLPNQSLPDGSLSHLQVPTGHAPTVPLPDGLLSHRSVSGPGGHVSGVPSGVLDHGGAGGVSLAGAPGGGGPSSGVPGGGGMPFMPMSPSGGAPKDEHRSDASGLVTGGAEPWTDEHGEVTREGEVVPSEGTPAGGPGLAHHGTGVGGVTLPDATDADVQAPAEHRKHDHDAVLVPTPVPLLVPQVGPGQPAQPVPPVPRGSGPGEVTPVRPVTPPTASRVGVGGVSVPSQGALRDVAAAERAAAQEGGMVPPYGMPGAAPKGGDERSDSSGLLLETEKGWAGPELEGLPSETQGAPVGGASLRGVNSAAPDELAEDRVAVVSCVEAAEDTSAWEAADTAMPWVLGGRRTEEAEEEELQLKYVLSDDDGWSDEDVAVSAAGVGADEDERSDAEGAVAVVEESGWSDGVDADFAAGLGLPQPPAPDHVTAEPVTGPGLATWRPDRSQVAAVEEPPALVTGYAGMLMSTAEVPDDEEEDEATDEAEENGEEANSSHGIADLLRQGADSWGAVPDETDALG